MGTVTPHRPPGTPVATALTPGKGYETLGMVTGGVPDAEREVAVTSPPFGLLRSHLHARYGACCL